MTHPPRATGVALLLLGLAAPSAAQVATGAQRYPLASSYTVTDLGSLNDLNSWAWSLNGRGEVTGWSSDGGVAFQAFRWSADQGMQGLGYPNQTSASVGAGINDLGWIAGSGGLASEDSVAFVNKKGKQLVELPDLGGGEAWARDINDQGLVVGESKVPGGAVHAVLWHPAGVTDLGALLAAQTSSASAISETGYVVGRADGEPYLFDGVGFVILPTLGSNGLPNDVNDAGLAVGSSLKKVGVGCTDCDTRAVLWKNGKVLELGVLAPPNAGSMSSAAHGINAIAQVVGWSTTHPLGTHHGFIWDPVHGMRDLDELVPDGWNVSEAYAINDAGQIAAVGSFGAFGPLRGLLLTPVRGGR